MEESTTNALKDVYAFYFGKTLSKEERNVFVNGTYNDVRRDFNNLMDYCANDVHATHQASGRGCPGKKTERSMMRYRAFERT